MIPIHRCYESMDLICLRIEGLDMVSEILLLGGNGYLGRELTRKWPGIFIHEDLIGNLDT